MQAPTKLLRVELEVCEDLDKLRDSTGLSYSNVIKKLLEESNGQNK